MKKTNFEQMSVEDLENRKTEMADELFSARMKLRIGQFKKTSEFSRLRKEIARINTIIRQREMQAAKEQQANG